MEYHVRHMQSGEEKVLQVMDVNDMVLNDHDEVIVFNAGMEKYYLLEDGEIAKLTQEKSKE